ncbi:M23 family metallopeptidase [Saccharothrix violaceirubra]|uniref:Murein DD-endopeptidase MepM/ murein hydrolase activator NlpD n=1 Tax=Saccharothrix violaceirubra TaxID=413306 RepID=A0A7W7T1A7_9PSEU|nr:M23 family metallopeptidase [Saccharothrix violaceirubra]MBB4964719.1 murein DD-endopeptidase MepM/ murein hydrolase activator NlpD [Saccharothrix violaceirubra]
MEDDRSAVTGRVAAAVVAAGTLATTVGVANGFGSTGPTIIPLAAGADLALAVTGQPAATQSPQTVHAVSPGLEAAKLMRSEGLVARQHVDQAIKHASDGYTARQAELKRKQEAEEAERARIAAEEEAKRPKAVKPAQGTFTSGFGGRWGTTHYGVDIANSIGTPILSAMEGTVVEAGPASGFGLWVRVQHADGTITVYGHVNEILVAQGQHVAAGAQIATMGNRGQSTGPHLHFEVWAGGSQKIDPVGWLAERGISL